MFFLRSLTIFSFFHDIDHDGVSISWVSRTRALMYMDEVIAFYVTYVQIRDRIYDLCSRVILVV